MIDTKRKKGPWNGVPFCVGLVVFNVRGARAPRASTLDAFVAAFAADRQLLAALAAA